jgi:mono/diheme cytochrome c family protein
MTRAIPAIRLAPILPILSILWACEPGDKPGPEYMPDMARGPAYKAFAPNPATRNGITLQRPVVGTIKRGFQPFHYGKGDAEAARAGAELTDPFHATAPVLAKGKALYEIYCLVCHGEHGKGDGPIAAKIPPPPSYKSDRVMGFRPGRIFHVITMGANKMPSYAAQLAPEERWQVITYVRSQLQELEEADPGSGPAPDAAPAPDATPAIEPPTPSPASGAAALTPAAGSAPAASTVPAASAPPASGSSPAAAQGSGGRP